jgi:carbon monoxide dehydrogenase subunit G
MRVAVVREVPVPAEQAWQALVDWPGQGDWMPLTRVRVLPGPPEGVGTRIEAVTGVGPIKVADPMEIVEWDAPRRCVIRHDGKVLRGTGTFEVAPYGPDRCLVRWEEDLRQPVALLTWFGKPFFTWALRRFERRCCGG